MANTVIQLKKSATPSVAPSSLAFGELAINYADGILYYKASNGAISSIITGGYSFGTVNANGTLVISDTYSDVLDIVPGQNITITGDAINDRITVGADLTAANNWANNVGSSANNNAALLATAGNSYAVSVGVGANNWSNTKLANTSGVSFAGDLYFPTGNVGIGTTSPEYKLDVNGDARITGNLTLGDATTDTITVNAANFNLANNISFDSGTLFIDKNNDRVGVGTTTPSANLHVYGTSMITSTAVNAGLGKIYLGAGGNNNFPIFEINNSADSNAFRVLNAGDWRIGSVGNYAVSLITNNTQRVFVGTNGNVGIGNTSPSSRLTVYGTNDSTQQIAIDGTGNYSSIKFRYNGADTGFIQSYQNSEFNIGTSTSALLNFYTNNTERMRITSAGNVGIGTSSPASQFHQKSLSANNYNNKIFRIDSNTDSRIATVTGDGRVFIGSDNGYNVVFSVDNKGEKKDSSYTMLIKDSYNLLMASSGFVTDSPNFSLGANNFGATIEFVSPAQNGMLTINKANTTIGRGNQSGTPDKTLRVYTQLSLPTTFRVQESDSQGSVESFGVYANNDSTARLVVANGRVGVGTSSPSYLFHLSSNNTSPSGDIARFESPVTSGGFTTVSFRHNVSGGADVTTAIGADGTKGLVGTTSNTDFALFSNFTEKMRITSAGNVGIGTTSPAYKLDVVGEIRGNAYRDATYGNNVLNLGTNIGGQVQLNSTIGQMLLDVNNDTHGILFRTGASITTKMSLTNAGNVGINTTTPKALLDVKPLSTSNTFSMVLSSGQNVDGFASLKYVAGYAHNDLLLGNFQDASGYSQTAISFGYTGDPARKLHIGSANSATFDSNASFVPAVTVTSGGRLGVGTTSPATTLHVIGTANVSSTIYTRDIEAPFYSLYNEGAGAYVGIKGNYLRFGGVSEFMRIANTSGYVGIGTTTPGAPLHVYRNVSGGSPIGVFEAGSAQSSIIELKDGAGTPNRWWLVSGLGTTTDGTFSIYDARQTVSRLNINSSGNVGIATLTPSALLDVSGSIKGAGLTLTGSSIISGSNRVTVDCLTASSKSRVLGWGANTSTRGTLSLGVLASDASLYSDSIFIDSTTNVGIGTTAPQTVLDVAGSDNNGIQYRTATRWISIGSYGGLSTVASGSGTEMVFSVGSERMRITSNGNIGIGTSSPGGKLTVAQPSGTYTSSAPFFSSLYDNTQHFNIYMDGNWNTHLSSIQVSTNQSALAFDTNGSERMRITANGTVGIGTSSPSIFSKLDVNGYGKFGTSAYGFFVGTVGSNAALDAGPNAITFYAGSTEKMRLTSDGDVLINQTSSLGTGKLGVAGRIAIDVNGSDSFSGQLYLTSPNGWPSNIQAAGPSSNGIAFWTYTDSWSERVRITGAGNVGIGTISPTTRIHAYSTTATGITLESTGDYAFTRYKNTSRSFDVGVTPTGSYYIWDDTSSAFRMQINSSGNVGIGTISPSYKLDVVGDVRANSFISGNSSIFTNTVITAASTDQIIDSFTTSTWRSAQYNITMTAGTDYHTTQISLIHDGTNAYITEYGTLSTANNLGTFSATVSGSTVRLNVIPTFANTSINMLRTTNK